MRAGDSESVDVFVPDGWGGAPVTVVAHDGLSEASLLERAADAGEGEMACVDLAGSGTDEPVPLTAVRGGQVLPFSGNAALAAARVLAATGGARTVRLALPLGDVEVEVPAAQQETLWFPAPAITVGASWPQPEVRPLLGLPARAGVELPATQLLSLGQPVLLVPVAGLDELSRCRLDGAAFKGYGVRRVRHQALRMAVYAFCFEARSDGHQLAARRFLPGEAEPEPASGTAVACLGAWLAQHDRLPAGQTLSLEQGHEMGRPSLLRLRPGAGGRVEVGGAVRSAVRTAADDA